MALVLLSNINLVILENQPTSSKDILNTAKESVKPHNGAMSTILSMSLSQALMVILQPKKLRQLDIQIWYQVSELPTMLALIITTALNKSWDQLRLKLNLKLTIKILLLPFNQSKFKRLDFYNEQPALNYLNLETKKS